jgi:dTDP-4-dehydrorhamnose reductase
LLVVSGVGGYVRILLTGASGQVGGELLRVLAGDVIAPGRHEMDLSDAAGDFRSLRKTIRAVEPQWIVNPAAYTAVDKAESEQDVAFAVNRDAVRAIGEEAVRVGAAVIHFSTDYVFDGLGTRAYTEKDATGPVSVYGASKLAGETALQESGAAHAIFRTSWVYGSTGKNFLLTILRLAPERELVRVVGDQHGAPTWSRDLAEMTAAVMLRCETEAAGGDVAAVLRDGGGVFHAAASGETTWYGFAKAAVELLREKEPGVRLAEIEAITTAEYPTAARRPENSRLDCAALGERFGWRMPEWRESLRKVMADLRVG